MKTFTPEDISELQACGFSYATARTSFLNVFLVNIDPRLKNRQIVFKIGINEQCYYSEYSLRFGGQSTGMKEILKSKELEPVLREAIQKKDIEIAKVLLNPDLYTLPAEDHLRAIGEGE